MPWYYFLFVGHKRLVKTSNTLIIFHHLHWALSNDYVGCAWSNSHNIVYCVHFGCAEHTHLHIVFYRTVWRRHNNIICVYVTENKNKNTIKPSDGRRATTARSTRKHNIRTRFPHHRKPVCTLKQQTERVGRWRQSLSCDLDVSTTNSGSSSKIAPSELLSSQRLRSAAIGFRQVVVRDRCNMVYCVETSRDERHSHRQKPGMNGGNENVFATNRVVVRRSAKLRYALLILQW